MERKGRTNGIIRDISLVRLRARASLPCQPYYSSFLYAAALAKHSLAIKKRSSPYLSASSTLR